MRLDFRESVFEVKIDVLRTFGSNDMEALSGAAFSQFGLKGFDEYGSQSLPASRPGEVDMEMGLKSAFDLCFEVQKIGIQLEVQGEGFLRARKVTHYSFFIQGQVKGFRMVEIDSKIPSLEGLALGVWETLIPFGGLDENGPGLIDERG